MYLLFLTHLHHGKNKKHWKSRSEITIVCSITKQRVNVCSITFTSEYVMPQQICHVSKEAKKKFYWSHSRSRAYIYPPCWYVHGVTCMLFTKYLTYILSRHTQIGAHKQASDHNEHEVNMISGIFH